MLRLVSRHIAPALWRLHSSCINGHECSFTNNIKYLGLGGPCAPRAVIGALGLGSLARSPEEWRARGKIHSQREGWGPSDGGSSMIHIGRLAGLEEPARCCLSALEICSNPGLSLSDHSTWHLVSVYMDYSIFILLVTPLWGVLGNQFELSDWSRDHASWVRGLSPGSFPPEVMLLLLPAATCVWCDVPKVPVSLRLVLVIFSLSWWYHLQHKFLILMKSSLSFFGHCTYVVLTKKP